MHLTQSLSTPSSNHCIKDFVWHRTGRRKAIVKLNCKDGSFNLEFSEQRAADSIETLFKHVKTYYIYSLKENQVFYVKSKSTYNIIEQTLK